MIRLEKASLTELPGLRDMLLELADGESGFTGTPFGTGTASLQATLQQFIDGEDPAKLQPGYVPQTIFWVIDETNHVVGMVRMRHHLNEKLLEYGGHIGYYIRPAHRNKGYAKSALALTLQHLRSLGVERALLTVNPANLASCKTAEANGGQAEPAPPDATQRKYWINC